MEPLAPQALWCSSWEESSHVGDRHSQWESHQGWWCPAACTRPSWLGKGRLCSHQVPGPIDALTALAGPCCRPGCACWQRSQSRSAEPHSLGHGGKQPAFGFPPPLPQPSPSIRKLGPQLSAYCNNNCSHWLFPAQFTKRALWK